MDHHGKTINQLSLRYKINDKFWIEFLYEAGHIPFHSKRASFVDEVSMSMNISEAEADEFAGKVLALNAVDRLLRYALNGTG